jgi:hypothetical protein
MLFYFPQSPAYDEGVAGGRSQRCRLGERTPGRCGHIAGALTAYGDGLLVGEGQD